jgi:Tfp pilus assembly protein PilF
MHYHLGVMQRQQNNLPAARTEFETALRLNPDNYKAHGNLAQIAQSDGRLEDAEHHARAALKIFPGDTMSRETMDAILRGRGARPAP